MKLFTNTWSKQKIQKNEDAAFTLDVFTAFKRINFYRSLHNILILTT